MSLARVALAGFASARCNVAMTPPRSARSGLPVRRTAILAVGAILAIAAATAPALAAGHHPAKHKPTLKLSIVASPGLPGAASNAFNSVSCASSSSCFAVGNSTTGSGLTAVDSPLIDHWDGHRWWPLATPSAPNSFLNAISCPTTSFCLAVGSVQRAGTDNNNYFAEKWSGGQWSIATPPGVAITDDGRLQGVACLSSKDCNAVGDFSYTDPVTTDTDTDAIIGHYNGKSWSAAAITGPFSTIGDTQLYGVSCATATWCVADGYLTRGVVLTTTNQKTWKADTKLGPAANSNLIDVSCLKPRSCTAVGSYDPSSSTLGELIDTGVGPNFTAHVLDLKSTKTTLTAALSIACRSSQDCLIAAYKSVSQGSSGTVSALAQRWNGHALTTVDSQKAHGWAESTATGVAVAGSTFWLVGGNSNAAFSSGSPLAEHS
jgi:hypothetical protein